MARMVSALSGVALSTSCLLATVDSQAQDQDAANKPPTLPPVIVKQDSSQHAKRRDLTKKKANPQATASPPADRGAGSSAEATAVSPTLQPTPVSQIGSSVTVITSQDIEAKQNRTVPDALSDVPGLNVVQTGGPGGVTSVFMRGTNANHTKVLVDGIDVSDPTSPDGAFDFAHLLTSGIDRIEVLRGPQSGLYGSDAIGGVIDIRTKPGSGPAQVTGSVEAGSFGTFNQTAGVSGSSGPFSYSFNAAHFRADEVPVTPLDLLPPGQARIDDSYDNQTYSARVGLAITKDFDVGVTARYVESALHFTGSEFNLNTFAYQPEPTQSQSDTQQWFTRAIAHQVLFGGAFDQTFGVGYTDYHRTDEDPAYGTSFNTGDRLKYDWTGIVKLVPGQVLTLGAEHQTDEIVNSPISAQMTNSAGFLQLQSSFGDRFFNAASVRYDSNDRFGDVTTYRIAPAFLIPETDTKLKASYGTGFKAPSLNELFVNYPDFFFYANPNLKPEESTGYDAGFEQKILAKRAEFGATYFHNGITNLITYEATAPAYTTYVNIARAETEGVETYFGFKPLTDVTLRADYTYTLAMDEELHEELLRRPKHKASLGAKWQATEALSLSATVIHVGDFVDTDRYGLIPRLNAPGYTVVNIAGSYDLGGGLTAFARIDNLFNEQYQDPTGFLRPGFGAFAGMKVSLNASELALERN
ncbi:MAG: TonB-dependent receptor plug domain-containing protein [Rhodomicrobium sp.]